MVEISQKQVRGKNLREWLNGATPEKAVDLFKRTLEFMAPAFKRRSFHYPKASLVPLDTLPENFVADEKGKIHFVDVTPPLTIGKGGYFITGKPGAATSIRILFSGELSH
ncbi:TPA: hypothetical protein HA244_01235 [Candidatus Micrarchaeota archaeon]|nr:hypothetical protein [Candidatus Micrarchaeota archaeon]